MGFGSYSYCFDDNFTVEVLVPVLLDRQGLVFPSISLFDHK